MFASVSIAARCYAFKLILNNRNWFYMTILSLLYISLCIYLHFSSIFVGIGGLLQLGDVLVLSFFHVSDFHPGHTVEPRNLPFGINIYWKPHILLPYKSEILEGKKVYSVFIL